MDKEYVLFIHSGILLSHKKNKIMPFAAMWIYLEIVILSEVNQKKTNISWYNLYVEPKNDKNELIYKTKNKLTNIENKLMVIKGDGASGAGDKIKNLRWICTCYYI